MDTVLIELGIALKHYKDAHTKKLILGLKVLNIFKEVYCLCLTHRAGAVYG